MRKITFVLRYAVLGLGIIPMALFGQTIDSTGLPGDNFSLEAALEIFKQSSSLEAFEQTLNTESSNVNNLDLDEDGQVDYVRVEDHKEGDLHAIVLQVPVSKKESQDIAVIEIEKTGANTAILQIIGDVDIYGEEVIVEPFEEDGTGGDKGGPQAEYTISRIVVNVYLWPCVQFVYRPGYRVYRSPWYWGYYPVAWWSPWRPRPWRTFHIHLGAHRHHYHQVTTHRVVHAHKVYTPRRKSSKVVHKRTTRMVKIKGTHRGVGAARTTTVKAGKTKGGVTAGKKTTTTTKSVKTKKGTAVGRKTTTTKGVKGKKGSAAGRKTTKKVKRKKGN